MAIVLSREGRNAEAEKLEREELDISRRVLGAEHPQTAASIYHLGVIAANRGNRTEALSLLRQALDHGLLPTGALGMEKDPGLSPSRAIRTSTPLLFTPSNAPPQPKPQNRGC